ncbi:hypothetical protein [Lacipirellula sp.]|uniref:hypothetical protein n=1 Tax=Lacipirellula sp. TaxID=2691419 RepID=UPI003D152A69
MEGMINFHDGLVGLDSCRASELPFSRTWSVIRSHLALLDGTRLIGFTAGNTEAVGSFLVFQYHGEEFCIHDKFANLFISVADAACGEATMREVLGHLSSLLSLRR